MFKIGVFKNDFSSNQLFNLIFLKVIKPLPQKLFYILADSKKDYDHLMKNSNSNFELITILIKEVDELFINLFF